MQISLVVQSRTDLRSIGSYQESALRRSISVTLVSFCRGGSNSEQQNWTTSITRQRDKCGAATRISEHLGEITVISYIIDCVGIMRTNALLSEHLGEITVMSYIIDCVGVMRTNVHKYYLIV